MSDGFPIVFVLFALVAVGAAYWQWEARKRRIAGFTGLTQRLGLRYAQEDPFGLLTEPFGLFRKGDGRAIEHVLDGTYRDTPIPARSTTGTTTSRPTRKGTGRGRTPTSAAS